MQEQPTFSSLVVTPHSLCTSVLDFPLEYGVIWTGKERSSILLYLCFLQKHPRVSDETLFQNHMLLILNVTLLATQLKFVKLFDRLVYFFVSKKSKPSEELHLGISNGWYISDKKDVERFWKCHRQTMLYVVLDCLSFLELQRLKIYQDRPAQNHASRKHHLLMFSLALQEHLFPST